MSQDIFNGAPTTLTTTAGDISEAVRREADLWSKSKYRAHSFSLPVKFHFALCSHALTSAATGSAMELR
jgi:hypothetical protein